MCIGVPMQVVSVDERYAQCRHFDAPLDGSTDRVDISLIDTPALDSWLLVFADAAREPLTEERAHQVANALRALTAVSNGETDHQLLADLFADLTEREPQLPAHLRPDSH